MPDNKSNYTITTSSTTTKIKLKM